jgi:iron complex outermembrane receptor protein
MKIARPALTLAFAALPLTLCAQEKALPTVTVSDTSIQEAAKPSAVDGKRIERMRAATSDTAKLLADTPGVNLNGAGGVSSLPSVRGMADDRLRIKVDGMDLTAACPNHMNPPLSYLDPSSVGLLQVYSITPVSVGGDSIGSSIVAETAKPEFARPGEDSLIKGQLGSFYRSNGHAKGINATASWANDMVNLSYTGAYATSGNYQAGGDFKTVTATGRPGHTLGLDEVGSTAYETRNQTLGVALRAVNHLVEARFGYQDIPYELYPNQRMDMLGNNAHRFNLRYLGAFNWGELEARTYRETVHHYMNFGADRQFIYGAADGMPMNTDSTTTGVVVKASVNMTERDVLRVGGEYLRYRLDDTWPPSPDCGTCVSGMAPLTFININDGKRERAGAFAEWEANWNRNWLSLLGLRFEQVTSDVGQVHGYNTTATYQVSSVGTLDDFNAMNRRRTDHNWDITALGRYTPTETSSYEFGLTRKTRSPNLYERYTWSTNNMALGMNNFTGDGNGYLGNPNLKPEVAYTLSATGDWRSADGTAGIKATPYFSRVSNYIDAICRPGTTCLTDRFVTLQYANQAARLYGIDISGRLPLAQTVVGAFGVKGLLSYTRGKNLDTGDGLYNIMPLNAKLTLTHEYAGWDNALEVVGVRGKNNVSAIRNEIKTPGYTLVNLRAAYAWKYARLDFGIENLFNKLYYLPTGGTSIGQGMTMSLNGIPWGIAVPGAGRSLYVGLTLKY